MQLTALLASAFLGGTAAQTTYVVELNAIPAIGAAEAAFGLSVYSRDQFGPLGFYASYISTPPERVGFDGIYDLISLFDGNDGELDTSDSSFAVRLFDYPDRYVDQTALTVGGTYPVVDGIYALFGAGWVWQQPLVRDGRDHRREGPDRSGEASFTLGALVDAGPGTVSVGYISGLERLQVGLGLVF